MKAPVLSLLVALFFMYLGMPLAAQQGFTRTTEGRVLILQSNSAGDNIHIIDPVTNTATRYDGRLVGVDPISG